MSTMTLPGYTADASVYRTINLYRSTVGGSFAGDGSAAVAPQSCEWYDPKSWACGVAIAAATVGCGASCEVVGPACYICWVGLIAGALAGCEDCLPTWVKGLIDQYGAGNGSSGGGDEPQPVQCQPGQKYCSKQRICVSKGALCPGQCFRNENCAKGELCFDGTCMNKELVT